MTEAELILECKNFNTLAQKELYEKYGPFLLSVCIRYTKNYEEAEDALHEGFLKIFSKINQFQHRGEGSLKAWMHKIIVNTTINFLNDKVKKRFQIESQRNLFDESDQFEDSYKEIDLKDIDQEFVDYGLIKDACFSEEELFNTLNEIPEIFKVVFNMHVIDGITHEEIAKQLKIELKTSKTRLFRARKMIQAKLFQKSIIKLAK